MCTAGNGNSMTWYLHSVPGNNKPPLNTEAKLLFNVTFMNSFTAHPTNSHTSESEYKSGDMNL